MRGAASVAPGVLEVKLVPPAVPSSYLARPTLDTRLDLSRQRRLTTVVAGPGYGKSATLAGWARRRRVAWYTIGREDADPWLLARGLMDALRVRVPGLVPDAALTIGLARGPDTATAGAARSNAHAAALALALQAQLRVDLVLVLDDVHELPPGGPAVELVEALCRHAPPRLHIVLSSRVKTPFPVERLRASGQIVELSSSDLAFDGAEVEQLLAGELGPAAVSIAPDLLTRTQGWPAAVRLAIEALRDLPPVEWRDELTSERAEGRLFAYLAEEVLTRASPTVVDLVTTMAPFDRFTADLALELGVAEARDLLSDLEQRGGVVISVGGGWYSLHPLLRAYASERLSDEPRSRQHRFERAAEWFERTGDHGAALDCLVMIGDARKVARFLGLRGHALVLAGRAGRVAEVTEGLPPEVRTPALDELEGTARQVDGDWAGALACFERSAAGSPRVAPAVAWRMGLIHYLRGELDLAIESYQRADGWPPSREQGHLGNPDWALLLAWSAAAWWVKGDAKRAHDLADAAHRVALSSGSHQAAAAAHTAMAMAAAMDGDRFANERHYLQALTHAEQAGDALQLIRIRTNRGSRCMEEGAYEDALAELDIALGMADRTGFDALRALALLNRGQTLMRLGRLDDARTDLEAARTAYGLSGSRMVSYALASLGDLHEARGELVLARSAYERAIALADPVDDLQGLVPALAGLARVLVAEDPDHAEAVALRAMAYPHSLAHQRALIAGAWVAVERGDHDAAAFRIGEAAERARERNDQAALAECHEVEASLATETPARLERLEAARELWYAVGSPIGLARVEVALAAAGAPGAGDLLRTARARAQVSGARSLALAATSALNDLDRAARADLSIDTLGRFRVVRRSGPIAPTEWQSRKARDLLKVLVARRGRPVTRDELVQLLWGDEADPERSSSRLSVALSTLRSVLDPEKSFAADHFVASDRTSLHLDLDHVSVDVEQFTDVARGAFVVSASGSGGDERLREADVLYGGDFLPDDPFADWAVPLRDETRRLHAEVLRALAASAAPRNDEAAARCLLRLLEHDPYDEAAHLDLVASLERLRRHGEARRAYRTYCTRMEEIDIEPAGFPQS